MPQSSNLFVFSPQQLRAHFQLFALLIGSAVTVGAQSAEETPPSMTTSAEMGDVQPERIQADTAVGANWMLHGRTYSAQRFSPLKQIDDTNVGKLGVAWSARIPSSDGLEATPIVVDGVIYISGSGNLVEAIDAGTGRLLWKWRPSDLGLEHWFTSWASRANRGVAVWKQKVFIGTADCRLFALNASTGSEIWNTQTCDPKEGYASTGSPLVAKDMVIIGNSGADTGAARGYISAYDSQSGQLRWRFYTVPGNPKQDFEQPILKWAATTWKGKDWWEHGGGNAWDAIEYDPDLNRVYFGTDTHTVPAGQNGDALFTNSIVAVDADTGQYVWHYQEVPNDSWDYNATSPIVLADLTIEAKQRRVLMQAARNGFFYVIDRENGALLSATPFVKVTWASRIDLETGRPMLTHDAQFYLNQSRSALIWPGGEGAHNWQPMSFNPLTGLVYIPALNAPARYYMDDGAAEEKLYVPHDGAARNPARHPISWDGRLIAWDPIAHNARWSITLKYPYEGGTLTTAGNLVFQSVINNEKGFLTGRRATDGRLLWNIPVGSSTQAAPVTYLNGGRQYLLLPLGPSGSVRYEPEYGDPPSANGPSGLIAFSLDADGTVPTEVVQKTPQPKPPAQFGSPALVARGQELYTAAGCAYCHGIQMNVAAGGMVPDLRYIPPAIHDSWNAIVLGGALKAAGMPSFGGHDQPMTGDTRGLSLSDAQAIRAFVIDRAWKLYDSTQHQNNKSPRTAKGTRSQ
jgi:quinohemoprotein ethanol dehydrogenase